MNLDKEKRASVEELMIHPQICYLLRDRKIQEMASNVKRKENDINKKENMLKDKELEVEK